MAAPVFEAAGTYLAQETASPAVTVPSGTAAGKLVAVSMFVDGAALTPTPDAGFADAEGAPSQIAAGSGAHSLFVWVKRLTGADAGTYTFALGASRYVEAVATLYSPVVAAGTPFDSPTDTATDIASNTVTPAVDVTTLGPDRLVVWAATNWSGGTWTAPASPAGFVKRAQGGFGLVTICDAPFPTEGSTGPVTGSCTGSDKRCVWMGALVGTTSAAVPGPPLVRRPLMGALLQL
ncbi:hypothetical protein ACBJ59_10680 [Nonomuraea sp. MTCD27]|uniref:hypothetical protein n=1 Tax=Nonomuraea sp. MTCD27 TaxID=1676747 RepID=UPI0035C01B17